MVRGSADPGPGLTTPPRSRTESSSPISTPMPPPKVSWGSWLPVLRVGPFYQIALAIKMAFVLSAIVFTALLVAKTTYRRLFAVLGSMAAAVAAVAQFHLFAHL